MKDQIKLSCDCGWTRRWGTKGLHYWRDVAPMLREAVRRHRYRARCNAYIHLSQE